MTRTVSSDLGALRSNMQGTVLGGDDPGFDEARSIWNGAIDRRPAAIAKCRRAEDVAAALGFAAARDLEVSVRGGGHSFSGASVGDGGMMINLAEMNRVQVDPEAGRVLVGGGATMADMDAATQEHGLAVTGGVISHTGVGGLTLGGGMGWLTHLLGLSIDNLTGARVVLADGRIVHADGTENAELFWGLRGGGGNFGVVTEFEFRVHPVGPMVQFTMMFWPMDQGPDALRLGREFVPTLPERAGLLFAVGLSAPPAPFVPEQYQLMPGYALLVAGFDGPDEHAATVAPLRRTLPPLFEFTTTMPYTALQSLLDDSAPWGIHGYEKALDLDELSDEVIAIVAEHAGRKASPLSFMPIFALDGAFCDVAEDATAFGGRRTPHFVCNLAAVAPDAQLLELDRMWARRAWDALRPCAAECGGYVNFMAEPDEERTRASYGSKYGRLARIKAEYDPGNVFHRNVNIRPASTGQ
ncbi:FAD-binding oxidoreductase [Nocardia veterana]|uniref:FAD-binding oxidoreductase n=1 Tax=Nocardia veterana TaxID=132249 RepID=A0A7X6LYJ6_9NOCA|nr:FAD-binding oxidoreductase [Nocardia veterana]NKY86112.1 FAD-binding oxidoreductase [Nocardia veterana]